LEEWNFDCPDSLDKTLLIKQITTLIKGQVVVKPNYHYYTHVRISQGERVYPKAFIIVEGLFALYWAELRNLYRLKVFIDASNDSCLERRLQRDIKERGFSPEFIRHQFKTTVLPMYRKYIQSTRKYADIILNGEKPVEQAVDRLLDICV